MSRLLLIASLLMAVAATASPSSPQTYDELCDAMIRQAQNAARAHNANNLDDVETYSAKVEELFNRAVEMDDTEPQAFLNMATFQTNSHKYDEAIANYDKVLAIFGADAADGEGDSEHNQQMRFRIEQARNQALYGKYSKLRDITYDGGFGNTSLAYEYALKQLEYTPEPHRTNHQVGTLEAMLCEYNKTLCEQSHYHFRISSFSTFQHVTKTYSDHIEDRGNKMKCFHSQLSVGVWPSSAAAADTGLAGGAAALGYSEVLHPFLGEYANNTKEDLSASNSGVFVNTLRGVYDIQGPDGIIMANFAKGNGDCSVLVQNGDFYVNLADNLFPPNPKGGSSRPANLRPPPAARLPPATRVLSLVHFASTAFYHWMSEALPKLIYFRQTYPDAEIYKILIPSKFPDVSKKGAVPSFIRDSLKYFNIDLKKDVIAYNANSGLTVDSRRVEDGGKDGELVAVTWDPSPCPSEEAFETDVMKRKMCASLTPPDALQVARRAISGVAKSHATLPLPEYPYVVVVGRGKGVSSRGLNTTRVSEMLREVLPEKIQLLDTRPVDTDKLGRGTPSPLAVPRKAFDASGRRLRTPDELAITVVEFDADSYSLADGLNLFRGASLIVGPHGGAFANMMACESGKTSVLEVGFSTVAAQQYKHMASALGLRYRRLVSGPDRLRRALNAPSLMAKPDVVVSNAVEVLLAQLISEDAAVRRTKLPAGSDAAKKTNQPSKDSGAAGDGDMNADIRFDDSKGKASSTSYTRSIDDDEYLTEEDEDEDDEL